MKAAYASDTHIDFYVTERNPLSKKMDRQIDKYIKEILKPQKADVFILAGDIGHYFQQNISFLLKLKEIYKYVIFTFGNHEMYLISDKQKKKYSKKSWNRVLELEEWAKNQDGIYFLNGNTIELDGVIFGGSGMHWDGSYYKELYNMNYNKETLINTWTEAMNDWKYILDGRDFHVFQLAYGSTLNHSSFDPLEFFKNERKKLDNILNCDVMISHYGPKPADDRPLQYRNHISSTFYYFDGLKDIERLGCKHWVYGHTHDRVDEFYKDCNLLCNPIGYPGENKGFKQMKVFEIKIKG